MKTKSGMFIAGLAMVIVAAMFGPVASAGCGDPLKEQPSPVVTWMSHQENSESNGRATIVGLWHLHYTASDGSPFLEPLKPWHADGTHVEQAFLPPIRGNVVFGVLQQVSQL